MKILFVFIFLMTTACSTTYPNKNLVGKDFPTIKGQALSGERWNIPQGMEGKATVFLIGYKQNSQFDIDRWLIGLDMKKVSLPIYELPAIQGFFPRMISTKIDNGMRKGIPQNLWKSVITIYGDGEEVQRFTGNERPNNARVVLIDEKGHILYFYDGGFSVSELNKLTKVSRNLR